MCVYSAHHPQSPRPSYVLVLFPLPCQWRSAIWDEMTLLTSWWKRRRRARSRALIRRGRPQGCDHTRYCRRRCSSAASTFTSISGTGASHTIACRGGCSPTRHRSHTCAAVTAASHAPARGSNLAQAVIARAVQLDIRQEVGVIDSVALAAAATAPEVGGCTVVVVIAIWCLLRYGPLRCGRDGRAGGRCDRSRWEEVRSDRHSALRLCRDALRGTTAAWTTDSTPYVSSSRNTVRCVRHVHSARGRTALAATD